MTTLQASKSLTDLARLKTESGLAPGVGEEIVGTFIPLAEEAAALIETAKGIEVTDPSQAKAIKQSGEVRVELKKVRCRVENSRKALNADALTRTKFINALAAHIESYIEPEETRLKEQEKIAERIEQERFAALMQDRRAKLAEFGFDTPIANLGEMKEPAFVEMLEGVKLQFEKRKAAAVKAEEDRKTADAARAAEEAAERARVNRGRERERAMLPLLPPGARLDLDSLAGMTAEEFDADLANTRAAYEDRQTAARREHERLAAEAEKARKEQEAAEAQAAADRKAREKAEAELKAKRDAEARAAAEAERVRKAAAMAPDAEKLRAFAAEIRALAMPTVGAAEARDIAEIGKQNLDAVAEWVEGMAAGLEGGGQ